MYRRLGDDCWYAMVTRRTHAWAHVSATSLEYGPLSFEMDADGDDEAEFRENAGASLDIYAQPT